MTIYAIFFLLQQDPILDAGCVLRVAGCGLKVEGCWLLQTQV